MRLLTCRECDEIGDAALKAGGLERVGSLTVHCHDLAEGHLRVVISPWRHVGTMSRLSQDEAAALGQILVIAARVFETEHSFPDYELSEQVDGHLEATMSFQTNLTCSEAIDLLDHAIFLRSL